MHVKEAVAVIGLGKMGKEIAHNILKSGYELYVYNRTKEACNELLLEGAHLLNSPKEAAEKVSFVITMLANDEALQTVAEGKDGLLSSSRTGFIHISMSTVSPELTKRLEDLHHKKGIEFIAAPVFGKPDAAKARKLIICCAGANKGKGRALTLLTHLSQKVYDFGTEAKNAMIVKLSGNFMLLSIVESLSEAFSFAETNGVNPKELYSFYSESIFQCPAVINYGKVIVEKQFEPAGFAMKLGHKDISLFKEAAGENIHLPLADLLIQRLEDGIQKDRSDLDWSAISLATKEKETR